MRKTFFEKCINLHLCRVALVLLLLVPAISSLQAIPSQSKTISGVVTSATDNEPLIGVSVQVKETSTGGITDMDGKYSVTAPDNTLLLKDTSEDSLPDYHLCLHCKDFEVCRWFAFYKDH